MNALLGERMSIITNKPQTTRHRIIGILSEENYQIVFSDTPGVIQDPAYRMQEAMNRFVHSTFEDADIMLFVTEASERFEDDDPILERLRTIKIPVFLVINKVDLLEDAQTLQLIQQWNERISFAESIPISALHQKNTGRLLEVILSYLQEGPEYYPKEQLTDRSERFFVSEIIREKILELYHQEIPYSCEVLVLSFKEGETNEGAPLTRISAEIYVARKTQKSIIIGKGGSAIKKLGMEARKQIEKFLQSKVFLELHVKVKENWRDDDRQLKHFGY
jgi:GTP-binding protein Era